LGYFPDKEGKGKADTEPVLVPLCLSSPAPLGSQKRKVFAAKATYEPSFGADQEDYYKEVNEQVKRRRSDYI